MHIHAERAVTAESRLGKNRDTASESRRGNKVSGGEACALSNFELNLRVEPCILHPYASA